MKIGNEAIVQIAVKTLLIERRYHLARIRKIDEWLREISRKWQLNIVLE